MMKSKGLGDTIHKVLESTGISVGVKWIWGKDCGCEERRRKLNELFPWGEGDCLTEDEWKWLSWWFESGELNEENSRKLVTIWNRVFSENFNWSNCKDCIDKIESDLRLVWQEYI